MKFFLLFLFFLFPLISAEITFFEGDFGQDFIVINENATLEVVAEVIESFCGNIICDVNEDCNTCMQDCGVCSTGRGDSSFALSLDEKIICDEVANFLELKKDLGDIKYLTDKINNESRIKVSEEKVFLYLENYNSKCNSIIILGKVISFRDVTSGSNNKSLIFLFVFGVGSLLLVIIIILILIKNKTKHKKRHKK